MKLTKASARPILCGAWLLVVALMMLYGLVALGTAEVVPLWFQGVGAIAWGWFWRDRMKAHEHGEADAK